jgi:HAD superfamily hydrolase (TIGR01509 family)
MKRFKAIIFDMDGVIVDSEPLHERAFRDVFLELGYAETHGIHFPDYYGKSDRLVWQDFVRKHEPPHTLEELLARKQRRFIDYLQAEEPIFDGLPELVARLAARCPLAVASGSPHVVIDRVLALRGLRPWFRAVVSASDVARGKPAPDIFLRAAELLGVPAAACVVIEDSVAGVDAARAAGMEVVAIANTFPAARLAHASAVTRTYAEIEELLLGPPAASAS